MQEQLHAVEADERYLQNLGKDEETACRLVLKTISTMAVRPYSWAFRFFCISFLAELLVFAFFAESFQADELQGKVFNLVLLVVFPPLCGLYGLYEAWEENRALYKLVVSVLRKDHDLFLSVIRLAKNNAVIQPVVEKLERMIFHS